MMNFFVYDGIDSRNHGVYIAQSNAFDAPERLVETVSIPGRNGDLIIDSGSFANFAATVKVFVRRDMQRNISALRSLLLSRSGYCRYEEALHPEEFRLARISGAFALEESDRVSAAMTVNLDCKPQRFLKDGERTITLTNGISIFNRTDFAAKPLIRLYGNGSLTISGRKITISGADGYTDVDCDIQEAYKGSTNKNGTLTLDSGAFPELASGSNAITFTGFSNVELTPRWWKI